MNTKKFVVTVMVVVILLASFTTSALADDPKPPIQPLVPLDCGVWAYDPVRSGASVNGTGEISCLTAHASLKVVVGLKDWTNRYTSKVKTCYNKNYCSTTATLSYSSGRQWLTDVSGYMGTYWQAYDTSNWVAIP
jgi:hypothetical protein